MDKLQERLTMSHVYRANDGKISREKLSRITGIKESRCREFIDGVKERGEIVGVISDLHMPFTHERALEHCVKRFTEQGVTRIVMIGDIVDFHRISRHSSEPDALGAKEEYEQARKMVDEWAEAFPYMVITEGNHDAIPKRQLAELGLPREFGKTLEDLMEFPDGWQVVDSIIIDDVFYTHIGAGGKYCASNLRDKMQMSVVQGHIHTAFFVHYSSNPHALTFGAVFGCLCDPDSYAFRYGRHSVNRPILGCGVVYSSEYAVAFPLRMS